MVMPPTIAPASNSSASVDLLTENLSLPGRIEPLNVTRNYGRFAVSPLESGYGLTWGNTLRRVLLSSLPGAAVTSVRIDGVDHEFSEIPHVREDITQLILQIKELRLVLHGVNSAKMKLNGVVGQVTAADIVPDAEVEIENLDLYLFTVDDEDANIEMTFTVEAGKGYSPAEERSSLTAFELPVDAIFSPIKRVDFNVEPARVGQRTNYDRLILEIWTDGTIRPQVALAQAGKIVIHQAMVFADVDEEYVDNIVPLPQEPEDSNTRALFHDKPIEELDLTVRVFNSLKRTGMTSVGDIVDAWIRGRDTMLNIRNFGEKSLDELEEKLKEKDYWRFIESAIADKED